MERCLLLLAACAPAPDEAPAPTPTAPAVVPPTALPPVRAADPEHPNILVITVCSLRADHVGTYGYSRATTPTLDAFAERAVVFDQAFSNATHTNAAHASLFSGLIPGHAGTLDVAEPLRPDVATLPELLARDGYRSAGFVDLESHFGPEAVAGMSRGFGEVHYHPLAEIGAAMSQWAGRGSQPWLAWVHVRLAHLPYGAGPPFTETPDPRVDAWLAAVRGPLVVDGSHDAANAEMTRIMDADPSVREDLVARYDAGVVDTDRQIGELLVAMRRYEAGTVQVIVADHGDALGERGHFGHQDVLQPEVLHVPLMIRVPGRAPRHAPETVALTDVLPTLLALTGGAPPEGLDGRSLVPALDGEALSARPVLAQTVTRAGAAAVQLSEVLIRPPWWYGTDGTLDRLDPVAGLVAEPQPDPALLEELEATRAAVSAGTRLNAARPVLAPDLKQTLRKQGYW